MKKKHENKGMTPHLAAIALYPGASSDVNELMALCISKPVFLPLRLCQLRGDNVAQPAIILIHSSYGNKLPYYRARGTPKAKNLKRTKWPLSSFALGFRNSLNQCGQQLVSPETRQHACSSWHCMILINAKTPATMGEICDLSAYASLNYESSISWRVSCDFCLNGKIIVPCRHCQSQVGWSMVPRTRGLGRSAGEEGKSVTDQKPFNQMKR